MRRVILYPLVFFGGWLFNFVVDIHFIAGFAAGWLSHSALGPYFDLLRDWIHEMANLIG